MTQPATFSPPPMVPLVPIRAPNGDVGRVPADRLDEAIAAKSVPISEEEFAHAQKLSARGGFMGHQLAGAEGVARGLTGGGSDVAARALARQLGGPELERSAMGDLEATKEANPVQSGVSELSGAMAGMLVPGVDELEGVNAARELKTVGGARSAVQEAEAARIAKATAGLEGKRAATETTRFADYADALKKYEAEHSTSPKFGLDDFAQRQADRTRGGLSGLAESKAVPPPKPAPLPAITHADVLREAEQFQTPEIAKAVQALGGGDGTAADVLSGLSTLGELSKGPSRIGGAIERTTARILGESRAARITSKALGGGAEAGLYGAEHEIDEETLGDTDLNAEKILAAAGYNSIAGLGLGAMTGATSEFRLRGIAGSSPTLQDLAGEQGWKAIDPALKFAKEADARAGGTAEVGKTLLKYDVIPREGTVLERALAPEELLPRTQRALSDVGAQIGEITKSTTGQVPIERIQQAVENVIDPLRRKAGFENIVSSLETYRDSLISNHLERNLIAGTGKPTIAVQDLIAQRRALDDLVYRESKALDPSLRVGFLRDIRKNLSSLETEAIDHASTSIGGAEGQRLRGLNKDYQRLSIAEDALLDRAARDSRNRSFSPTDYATGLATAAGALAAGHPIAALGGAAVSSAHKFIRERGNSVAASYLDKLAQLGAVQHAVSGVNRDTETAISAFMRGKKAPNLQTFSLPPYRGGELQTQFERAVERTKNPPDPPNLQHAPQISKALRAATLRATTFLQSKIPEPVNHDPYSLTPQLASQRFSEHDMQQFLRYYDARQHPGLLAHELAHGQIHPETVETVKVVAPRLYAELGDSIMEAAMERDTPLSYDQELQLGILFNRPTHWSLDPAFVQTMQASKVASPPKPQNGPKKSPGHRAAAARDNGSRFATTTEALQSGQHGKG